MRESLLTQARNITVRGACCNAWAGRREPYRRTRWFDEHMPDPTGFLGRPLLGTDMDDQSPKRCGRLTADRGRPRPAGRLQPPRGIKSLAYGSHLMAQRRSAHSHATQNG